METAKSINEISDVNEEGDPYLSEKLIEISAKNDAVLMACIAPYVGLKISPTKTVKAQTGLSEEFAVETAINRIEAKTNNRKLMLLSIVWRIGAVFIQDSAWATKNLQ